MKIVGQDKLRKEIERVFEIFQASNAKIRPHFILTGESGSGKTLTIKALAAKHKLGFLELNAAQLTKEGTSGNSLSKALSGLLTTGGKPTIVFVDEFDKLFISGNSNNSMAHESTTGVQNEFLKVLETEQTAVFGDYGKYVDVKASHLLFVFAGAFNNEPNMTLDKLRDLGIKTEFLGRVGLVYNTFPLSIEDMFVILEESPLLEMYIKLFPDVDRESALYKIKAHIQRNYGMNTLGARYVNTLINQYFIKGGILTEEEVQEVSFTKKLSLRVDDDLDNL